MENKDLIRICPKCQKINPKIDRNIEYNFGTVYEQCKEPIGIKFYFFGIFTKVKCCDFIGLIRTNSSLQDHWFYGHMENGKLVYDKNKSRITLYNK